MALNFALVNGLTVIYSDNGLELCSGEWFNGKTAAFKVADLGSNPCSPATTLIRIALLLVTTGRFSTVKVTNG